MNTRSFLKIRSLVLMCTVPAVGVCLSLVALPVLGVSQGDVGTTSTGSLTVEATRVGQVQVEGISDDIDFGNINGSAAVSSTVTKCVHSSYDSSEYGITLSSANNTGTTFRMKKSGADAYVEYNVSFTDKDSNTHTLSHGVKVNEKTGVSHTTTCTNSATGQTSLTVTIAASDISSMPLGAYTDTLTILVAETS